MKLSINVRNKIILRRDDNIMVKYGIKNKQGDYVFIFHALPNEITEFQWYITSEKECDGEKIEGQCFESLTIWSNQIRENGYEGKYLYCKYLDKNTKIYCNTEYVKLYADAKNMIAVNVVFDDISMFDDKGDIIKLVE